jgi:hypothetical protein
VVSAASDTPKIHVDGGPLARHTARVNAPVDVSVEIQDPLRRCFEQFETDCVRDCCGIDAIDADVAGVTEWAATLAPQDLAVAAAQVDDLLALAADRSRVVTLMFLNHATVTDDARSELLSLLTSIKNGFTAARLSWTRLPKTSLDLTFLAMAPDASDDEIRVRALRFAAGRDRPAGDLDVRVAAFYEVLRDKYPDSGLGAGSEETPWASSPLVVGIDHVTINLRHDRAGDVIDTILELAAIHRLVVLDPQDGTITRPHRSGSTTRKTATP